MSQEKPNQTNPNKQKPKTKNPPRFHNQIQQENRKHIWFLNWVWRSKPVTRELGRCTRQEDHTLKLILSYQGSWRVETQPSKQRQKLSFLQNFPKPSISHHAFYQKAKKLREMLLTCFFFRSKLSYRAIPKKKMFPQSQSSFRLSVSDSQHPSLLKRKKIKPHITGLHLG